MEGFTMHDGSRRPGHKNNPSLLLPQRGPLSLQSGPPVPNGSPRWNVGSGTVGHGNFPDLKAYVGDGPILVVLDRDGIAVALGGCRSGDAEARGGGKKAPAMEMHGKARLRIANAGLLSGRAGRGQ